MRLAGPLLVGAFTLVLGGMTLYSEENLHLPGNQLGFEPVQPVAYSHRLHAGELKIDCLYCHFGAQTSRHAGPPPEQVCMNCHATVTAAFDALLTERLLALQEKRDPRRIVSEKLKPLYDAVGLGDDGKPDPARTPQPIRWRRVHNLPDFVFFDHSVHVARGVACQVCHGPVQAMERVRQESDLSMGWCVNCHRANGVTGSVALPPVATPPAVHVSTDCAACHY